METEQAIVKRDDTLPFKMMDALDDELIIAELEGRMPEILTYHFSDKGQEIWGLSKAGVDEATGELSKQGEVIRELELNFTDGVNEAFFQVKAGRYVISKNGQEVLLDTKFGTKRQAKTTSTGKVNSFWYEQGSIKACRNASMRLIPKTIVQAVIENAKKKGKVKEVKKQEGQPQGEGKPESPPETQPSGSGGIQGQTDFLEQMKRYKVKVGQTKFNEILTGRYSCMKAEEVKTEDQSLILKEMEAAYKERTEKK